MTSRAFWEAAVAFLLSERDRHAEDIAAIDHKLQLIQEHRGVVIADIAAADFLDEEGIIG